VFGRWGTNYIYGTWSVLTALAQAHIPHDDPAYGAPPNGSSSSRTPTALGREQ